MKHIPFEVTLLALFCIDTRDGKTYETVRIGEQVWMAENLNYEAEGSKCYNNSISYCDKYGRLYNWNTAMKACPKGWHLLSLFKRGDLLAIEKALSERETAGAR
jgi:uncharacterized protein (TIGR02145 family)